VRHGHRIDPGRKRNLILNESGRLTVDGRERTFETVGPASDAPTGMVLVLHGSKQSGRRVRNFSGCSFDRLAQDASTLAVYPDAYKKSWNDARRTVRTPARARGVDDVAFLAALIDQYKGLPVYVVGYSNGGQMAIKLVHEIPDRLSGAVIISATLPVAANLVVNDKHLPMPIVLIHGTLDPVVPYGGGIASMWGLGSGGRGLSAFDSAQYFARRNGITATPDTEQLRHLPESGKTSAIRQRWAQEGKDSVTLYTVTNGGHVIPNPTTRASLLGRTTRDIDAADTVAELMAEPSEK
jgi:polyhydroxybutyrate depolymerase